MQVFHNLMTKMPLVTKELKNVSFFFLLSFFFSPEQASIAALMCSFKSYLQKCATVLTKVQRNIKLEGTNYPTCSSKLKQKETCWI